MHLPCTPQIDGWPAQGGVVEEWFDGVLPVPAEQHRRPFEIVLETPQLAPLGARGAAHHAAVLAVLRAARLLRTHGANI